MGTGNFILYCITLLLLPLINLVWQSLWGIKNKRISVHDGWQSSRWRRMSSRTTQRSREMQCECEMPNTISSAMQTWAMVPTDYALHLKSRFAQSLQKILLRAMWLINYCTLKQCSVTLQVIIIANTVVVYIAYYPDINILFVYYQYTITHSIISLLYHWLVVAITDQYSN